MAVALGLFVAWLAYARSATPGQRGRVALLAALRCAAVALVAALLVGAPSAPPRVARPLLAIDASSSARRAAGDDSTVVRTVRSAWQRAVDASASDAIVLVGDSLRDVVRADLARVVPADAASRVRPAVDRAAALGRPLWLLTDGDVDDAESLADAPPGSRVQVIPREAKRDVAVADVAVPSAATAGDTLSVSALLVSGANGSADGTLQLALDGVAAGSMPVPPLAAFASTRLTLRVPLPRGARTSLLAATVRVSGDVEPRNDTLTASIEISDRPPAVFVSTAPDLDVREALVVLRGALALPTRAYLRVAPSVWREEGTLAPIAEAEVRARAAAAGLLIVHGDTTWAPKSGSTQRASRALWSPAPPTVLAKAGEISRAAEWYAVGAPVSPLSSALAGLPFDSLPPLTLNGPARGSITVLDAKLGKRGDAVPAISAREDAGMRTLLISGSGYAGWSLRGGRSAEAFAALWGTIFDWLAVGRGDQRAARPVSSWMRAGEPVRWRRGGTDSLASVRITRRNASGAVADSIRVHFTAGAVEAETPPLAPGVYDVQTTGGASVLVVNMSREWIPRVPALRDATLSSGSLSSDAPRVSDHWWPFVASLLLLCAEWVVRRVAGLR